MNPAVLIVDMQPYFLRTAVNKEIIIDSQKKLIRYCDKKNIPVVLIQSVSVETGKEYGWTIDEIWKEWLKISSQKNIVDKIGPDAFTTQYLNEELTSWEIDFILFAGVYGGQCVRKTAKHAINLGYEIASSKDLISDEPAGRRMNENLWPSTKQFFDREGKLCENYSETVKTLQDCLEGKSK